MRAVKSRWRSSAWGGTTTCVLSKILISCQNGILLHTNSEYYTTAGSNLTSSFTGYLPRVRLPGIVHASRRGKGSAPPFSFRWPLPGRFRAPGRGGNGFHPPFSFRLAEKKMGRGRSKRKGRSLANRERLVLSAKLLSAFAETSLPPAPGPALSASLSATSSA